MKLSIKRAHADSVRRAINYKDKKDKAALCRTKVSDYLVDLLKKAYLENRSIDMKTACSYIRKVYTDAGIDDYTYGNAQKITSMSLKYFLSWEHACYNKNLFKEAWFPVDRIMISKIKDEYGIEWRGKDSWSKCDNFESFESFQQSVKSYIDSNYIDEHGEKLSLLVWEIYFWDPNFYKNG